MIFLCEGGVVNPEMHYRKIGPSESFSVQALKPIHESLHVMRASLAKPGYDFEYYITGVIDGQEVIYPVTGGKEPTSINQTVATIAESLGILKFSADWFCREGNSVVPESREVLPVV